MAHCSFLDDDNDVDDDDVDNDVDNEDMKRDGLVIGLLLACYWLDIV